MLLGDRAKQLKYEEDSDAQAAAERLQSMLNEAAEGHIELPRASALIARMYKVVQDEIDLHNSTAIRGVNAKYKGWLRAVPSDVAAIISIRECIKQCSVPSEPVRVQALTVAVGQQLELEARIRQAEVVNNQYMQRVHDQVKEHGTTSTRHIRRLYNVAIDRVMKGEIDLDLTRADMLHIGKYGVDACLNAGLLQLVRGSGNATHFELAPEVMQFLHGYNENDVRSVTSKIDSRMYCPPEPWSNLYDGGYLSTRRKASAPLMSVRRIRKEVRAAVADAFTAENMPEVFQAGNYMQSIAFAVHAPTRDAIERLWRAGGGVLGVPRNTQPRKPEMPLGEAWVKEGASERDLAIFTKWKRRVVKWYDDVRTWKGKVREIGAFMRASQDSGTPIWFPMYFDLRGRWYYRGVPNPQGSDLAKAVLHFHEKRALGADGVFWLKVHIANSYGYDKTRFEDRARWTEQNWKSIEAALDSPEDHPDVWGTDAPWCMYSAAWELRAAYLSGNPSTYRTGIPVHMDATCSGLQHFSALLRDPVGALYVNLNDPMQCGPKQDVYARVAENVMGMFKIDSTSTNPEIAAMASWWLQNGLPRALAKKPVMTFVYGATQRGTAEHIEDMAEEEFHVVWPDEATSFKYCTYAAKKLFQGIAAAVPAAAAAMHWLKEVVRQMPNGQRMQWRTPTGFLVQHDYQAYSEVRVNIRSCGMQKTLLRDWQEGTRPHAMQNAIAPNFVHALDASHLTLTALSMQKQGMQIVAIHDSFGTHPSDVARMHQCIREEFINLYSRTNILGEFLWSVSGVGEPPTRGDFDIQAVRDSEFFFC